MFDRRRRSPRAKISRRRPVSLELLEPRLVLDSTVVFNEIMYHPAGDDDSVEWIELHNQMAVDMDISGWSLAGGINYEFADDTVIDGRGYIVVASSPAALLSQTGFSGALGPFTGRLSNGGEELQLVNNSNRIMNVVDYRDGGDWPVGPDGSGFTLAKREEVQASHEPQNWTTSAQQRGTPGAENFPPPGQAPQPTTQTLIDTGASARLLVPGDATLGLSWTEATFIDSSWTQGPTGIGYEASGSSVVAYGNLTGAEGSSSFSGPWGHDFVVNLSIIVTQLGVFDSGADGLSRTLTAELWSRSGNTGTELAQLLFTTAAPGVLVDSNRLKPLATPLELSPGDYTIVAHGYGASEKAGHEGVSGPGSEFKTLNDSGDAISFVDSRFGFSPGSFPTIPEGSISVNNFSAGTFQFTTGGVSGKVTTDIESEMFDENTSAFIRVPFTFNSTDTIQSMTMTMGYSDGFVAYLNGEEVARRNAPMSVAWNSAATTNAGGFVTEVIDVSAAISELQRGTNVLAIHGLNAVVDDPQFLILPELEIVTLPPDVEPEIMLAINEVAPGGQSEFFLEIANDSGMSLSVDGFVLASSVGAQYTFPAQSIAAADFLAVTDAETGFLPTDGDTLFLYSSSAQSNLVDARRVTGRLRGRAPGYDGRWLYPDVATSAAANSFSFYDEIVINEIMYHHQPNFGTEGTPETYIATELLSIDNTQWRYNQTDGFDGGGIGATWYTSSHPIGTLNWFEGPSPLGFETSPGSLPLGINTTLADPPTNNPFIITTYFETEFQFNGDLNDVTNLRLTHMIDDAAVFYLNGQEIDRYNMSGAAGNPVGVDELASSVVDNATLVTSSVLAADALQMGTNRLSVEVHQQGAGSSDIVFAAELSALEELTPPIGGDPYTDNVEEWIELYNRGMTTVDLSGWQLDRAISYQFPPGTTMAADTYLVVASDAVSLVAANPGIQVVGDFSGRLNNKGEMISLVDQNNNPVDEVHYYDGGKWPEFADGGGSSLELRDPRADNSKAEAWAGSDESGRSVWNTYSIRGTASQTFGPNQWHELVLGLLESGEVLLDDITVVEEPDGINRQLIQNGTFEGDTLGNEPANWRIIGNQHGQVVVDPEDPGNQVLYFSATGPTWNIGNKADTTLKDGSSFVTINGSNEYEISFRAKWLRGSNQLNSRLGFNRLPKTFQLEISPGGGTPGTQNSAHAANIGPTYTSLSHDPVVPGTGQAVTVSVVADDPDGVSDMTLWWKIDGGASQSTSMVIGAGGLYTGNIPGQANGTVVQFYVEGQDGSLTSSTFPAAGADSRALYKVRNNPKSPDPIDTIEVIMFQAENAPLYDTTKAMSNHFVGATVVHNNSEVFYDVRVRQRGTLPGRNIADRQDNFRIEFHPDQRFRGIQQSIAVDGSGNGPTPDQQDEIIATHMLNRAGNGISMYYDLVHLVHPLSHHDGAKILQLARYDNIFLEEQFGTDSGGTVFEMSLARYEVETTCCGTEGPKRTNIYGELGSDITDLGDDKESYRWQFLIKNNRSRDDYDAMIAMAKAFDLTGSALDAALEQTIDIDAWMRNFAFQALIETRDVWSLLEHNVIFYVRPSDQKVIALPIDMDHIMLDVDGLLHGGANLGKIINRPANLRLFYGHMHDFMNTSYNSSYMSSWVSHYGSLAGQNFGRNLSFISSRFNYINGQLPGQVTFQVNTTNPLDVGDATSATLEGTGWINVREIRLAGDNQPLDVYWRAVSTNYAQTWEVTIPLTAGTNSYDLQAYDYQGNLVATDSISVTSSATNDVTGSLRITELNYNPADPTALELASIPGLDNDDFEFVELQNIGSGSIELLNSRFTDGIDFTFGAAQLAAGERGVVVRDNAAFALRYGSSPKVLGQFTSGRLNNNGEKLTLMDAFDNVVLDFSYGDSDPWPDRADRSGGTLELVDPQNTPTDQYGKYYHWRGSTASGGSPGAAGQSPIGVVVNEVLAATDPPVPESDSIELYNTTGSQIDIGGWYLSNSAGDFLKFEIPSGTMLPGGGYLVFDESDFNPTPLTPGPDDFALSGAHGDDVWLIDPDGGGPSVMWFVDDAHFGSSTDGESFGRLPDSSGRLLPAESLTLGASNSVGRVGPLVISEVNYNPGTPAAGALAIEPTLVANDLEFIEIYNPTGAAVDLTNWQLRGGVDYDFDGGTMIGAGETLVVISFNPVDVVNQARLAALRAHYEIDSNVQLVGGYQNLLSDGGQRVQLQRPDTPPLEEPLFIPHQHEDEVLYDSLAPWPTAADGTGVSLHRTRPGSIGSDAASWTAGSAMPGRPDLRGDSDLDGDVDTGDLTTAIINFSGAGGTGKTWADGDTDGDSDIDTADLTTAIINFTGATSRSSALRAAVLVPPITALPSRVTGRVTGDCAEDESRLGLIEPELRISDRSITTRAPLPDLANQQIRDQWLSTSHSRARVQKSRLSLESEVVDDVLQHVRDWSA